MALKLFDFKCYNQVICDILVLFTFAPARDVIDNKNGSQFHILTISRSKLLLPKIVIIVDISIFIFILFQTQERNQKTLSFMSGIFYQLKEF
jgi:hypothetical protein